MKRGAPSLGVAARRGPASTAPPLEVARAGVGRRRAAAAAASGAAGDAARVNRAAGAGAARQREQHRAAPARAAAAPAWATPRRRRRCSRRRRRRRRRCPRRRPRRRRRPPRRRRPRRRPPAALGACSHSSAVVHRAVAPGRRGAAQSIRDRASRGDAPEPGAAQVLVERGLLVRLGARAPRAALLEQEAGPPSPAHEREKQKMGRARGGLTTSSARGGGWLVIRER